MVPLGDLTGDVLTVAALTKVWMEFCSTAIGTVPLPWSKWSCLSSKPKPDLGAGLVSTVFLIYRNESIMPKCQACHALTSPPGKKNTVIHFLSTLALSEKGAYPKFPIQ